MKFPVEWLIESLKQSINDDKSLNHLNLELRKLNDSDIRALISTLLTANNLTFLNVSMNSIWHEGVAILASLTSLRALDLSCNQVGDLGAQAFSLCQSLNFFGCST